MYCPINKVAVGTVIEYLGWRGIVVKQLGYRLGTNCCTLDNNEIVEFGEDGGMGKDLNEFPENKRVMKTKWYYSYKSLVKVLA